MQMDVFVRLQTKLVAEERMSYPYAAILAENALYRFDERVREGVMLLLDDKLTEDFEVEGHTLCEILDEVGGSMLRALFIMDILVKDPTRVEMAIWSMH